MCLLLTRSSACRLRGLGVTTAPSAVRRGSNPAFHNRLWVADLGPLPVFDRRYFLCVVLDAYSGRCQGWHFSGRLDPDLIGFAVSAAVRNCWPTPFRPRLTRPVALALGARCGAAGVSPRVQPAPGDARESIAADFFRWLDADLISSTGWPNEERAGAVIEDWIVSYYNEAVSSPLIPDWTLDLALRTTGSGA
jgi:transposase InsO family protein